MFRIIQRIIKYFKDDRKTSYKEIKEISRSKSEIINFVSDKKQTICILSGRPIDIEKPFVLKAEKRNNIMWTSYCFNRIENKRPNEDEQFILYQMV